MKKFLAIKKIEICRLMYAASKDHTEWGNLDPKR